MQEVNLDGEKDGSNLKSRTPLLLQDVQADSPKLVYVWVVDPGDEPDLRIVVMVLMLVAILMMMMMIMKFLLLLERSSGNLPAETAPV